ncbi:MAG: GyrI-like domain-containing protein [Rhodoplanes sp.]
MRSSRLVIALAGAVMTFGLWQSGFALGQAVEEKPAAPPATAAPSAPGPPSSPSGPAATAAGAPASPSDPSAKAAQPTPPLAAEAQPDDASGQEVTMTEQPIVYVSGAASWENAFATIVDSFKKVYAFLEKENITPTGPPMTIYTSTEDKGFQFRAAVPVAEPPANLPETFAAAKSPAGKALKYVHRGTYDSLDATYELITNQLDEKGLEAQDVFVETYLNDPRTTPDDKLAIEVYVPIR